MIRSFLDRRTARIAGVGVGLVLASFLALDLWLMPLPPERLHRPASTFVFSREGRLLTAYTSHDSFWRYPMKVDDISPRLVESVIATEDRFFDYHPGVNLASLAQAAVDNFRAGKVVRGGSTITMQIARMMEPKERTVANKLREIFRAVQLELRYSKSELLEFYLNLVPYGGNIEGVGAAAHFYFGKAPSELTWSEAALLTAIPASPERYRPDRHRPAALARREKVLRGLRESGVITDREYRSATVEELPSGRQPVPRIAPHLARMLREARRDSPEVHSTIRYETQLLCERLARDYGRQLAGRDIHNLALVVLDNRSGQVLALVGSPDFDDVLHGGQVNGAIAPRSPGSALKPFVYALAFESGTLSPEQKVADIPVNYGGYAPENYDEVYHGLVSVREALVRSFNVPAVNAAAEVGLAEVHGFLRRGGLTTLEREYYEYGLPLVLGSGEVRLVELANLYATLARGGLYRSLRYTLNGDTTGTARLLSDGASYLAADILLGLHRPDLPGSWESAAGRFPVAWKTGTSYGRRDAWAIGFTPQYTVGVWAGNFSGSGSVDLVGAGIAAPVMFDILGQLVKPGAHRWFERPGDVEERAVCVVSGRPAGRFCTETRPELFLLGKSPSATCTVHRPILVDRTTGLRLRANCTAGIEVERRGIETWPPRIASWLVDAGLRKPLPEYAPECRETRESDQPLIVTPREGAVYRLVDQLPSEYQKIRLQASLPNGDGAVHWFLDGELLAVARAGEITFYRPDRGRHDLLCVAESGQSASVSFDVR